MVRQLRGSSRDYLCSTSRRSAASTGRSSDPRRAAWELGTASCPVGCLEPCLKTARKARRASSNSCFLRHKDGEGAIAVSSSVNHPGGLGIGSIEDKRFPHTRLSIQYLGTPIIPLPMSATPRPHHRQAKVTISLALSLPAMEVRAASRPLPPHANAQLRVFAGKKFLWGVAPQGLGYTVAVRASAPILTGNKNQETNMTHGITSL